MVHATVKSSLLHGLANQFDNLAPTVREHQEMDLEIALHWSLWLFEPGNLFFKDGQIMASSSHLRLQKVIEMG